MSKPCYTGKSHLILDIHGTPGILPAPVPPARPVHQHRVTPHHGVRRPRLAPIAAVRELDIQAELDSGQLEYQFNTFEGLGGPEN